jgi:putative transcriptional regulator
MRPRHDILNSLRRHRLLADGMTQEDLADRVGATRQTILAIEKGNYNPSVGLALRLAAVFGVAVEEIFQLEEGGDDE